jgi:hypothetical protein
MCLRCIRGDKIPHGSLRGVSPELRFQTKIVIEGSCHRWMGALADGRYGNFWDGKKQVRAHVFAWEQVNGPVPQGLQLDHFKWPNDGCLGTRCVNPEHLRATTPWENTLRSSNPTSKNLAKTQCVNGHEFTDENTLWRASGGRSCRTCNRDRMRKLRALTREKLG